MTGTSRFDAPLNVVRGINAGRYTELSFDMAGDLVQVQVSPSFHYEGAGATWLCHDVRNTKDEVLNSELYSCTAM